MSQPSIRLTRHDPLVDHPAAAMDRTRAFARKILAVPKSAIPQHVPKRWPKKRKAN